MDLISAVYIVFRESEIKINNLTILFHNFLLVRRNALFFHRKEKKADIQTKFFLAQFLFHSDV